MCRQVVPEAVHSKLAEMRPGDPIPTISGFRMVTVLFIKVRSTRKANAAQPDRAAQPRGSGRRSPALVV